jgi:TetR/AcrR family transcriptional repressor of nem operon
MRVTREEAAASRERIVESAARLFRERGLEGIGVADLMQDAGLTHGGFYGHFASKDELKVEACARALSRAVARWTHLVESEKAPVAALAKAYLSARHRDDPGGGCAFAAIGGEAARDAPAVRRVFTEGLRKLLAVLARVSPGRSAAARRRQAIATYASLVGAIVLARAVDDAKLSEEILHAVSRSCALAAPRGGGAVQRRDPRSGDSR